MYVPTMDHQAYKCCHDNNCHDNNCWSWSLNWIQWQIRSVLRKYIS